MTGVKILGVGKCVPKTIASNEDFAKIVDTNDEWITTRTGIKQRHISNGEPTYYLAAQSAKEAIENAGINVSDIGLILVTTLTGDYVTPSCSCMVQRELGAIGCMTIDINCACSGFSYGIDMAKRYLQTEENMKYALVISAEELSKIVDYTDRATCVLFGDGAAALVLEKQEDTLYSSYLGADGNGAKNLVAKALGTNCPFEGEKFEIDHQMPETKEHYLYQDGREVYKFATRVLPIAVTECCAKAGLEAGDIDVIIPHQANYRIIETAAKNLGISMDKFFLNLDKNGNTSSASIPLAFYDAVKSGKIKRGDKVCFVGFGAGLTYGCVIIEY